MKSWICVVCGYVHSGDAPPDVCPVCGAGAEDFEEQKVAAPKPVTRVWTCLTCGYTHEGDAPPESCPVCGVPAERFEAVAPGTPAVRSGRPVHVLIVGAGIAGVSAAEAIVQSDSAARVTLLHDESALPYYRLSLTRYLAGEIGGDALPIHPAAWYVENRIERLGGVKVTRLIPEDRAVELADGRRLTGDAVIWATGAHAFIPPLPGADLAGVFPLRTIADADAILSRAASRPACAVIGGGILGLETAGALARRGVPVTVLESHEWLMPRQLNRAASERLEIHLGKLGVRVLKSVRTAALEGTDAVERIRFEGEAGDLPANLVILATGIRPNTACARKAGLPVDRGILVDSQMRCAPGIFAAGDVAEHQGTLYGTWIPAQSQGHMAGLNAVGSAVEFGGIPRANAVKVLGIDLLSLGRFEPSDGADRVVAGRSGEAFAHFLFRDGKMEGAILLGHPDQTAAVKRAIEERRDFSALLHTQPDPQDIFKTLHPVPRTQHPVPRTQNLEPSTHKEPPCPQKTT